MTGQQFEHVVEEADAGGARARPVEGQRERDLGLARAALLLGVRLVGSCLPLTIADSPWTGKPSALAIGADVRASFSAASGGISTVVIRRRKAPGPSGPEKRAAPAVGRT